MKNVKYAFLFSQMTSELEELEKLPFSQRTRITFSFRIVLEYWENVRSLLRCRPFENEGEEITFYKSIKPGFTSLLEYYILVYHAELFRPVESDNNFACSFWKKELEKVYRFYKSNRHFISYYRSGCTSFDRLYFIANAASAEQSFNKLYDTDSSFTTLHGNLVSSLLAMEKYKEYIRFHFPGNKIRKKE